LAGKQKEGGTATVFCAAVLLSTATKTMADNNGANEAEEEQTAIAVLRRNDPHLTDVTIPLVEYSHRVADLAEALLETDFITKATFDLTGTRPNDDWKPLLQTIAIDEKLEKIHVLDNVVPGLRLPPAVACRFVEAATSRRGSTPRVQVISLHCLNISNSIFSHFGDNFTTGKELVLQLINVNFEDLELPTLAAALQSASNLTTLSMGGMRDNLLLAIAKSLPSCKSLKRVVFHLTDQNEDRMPFLEAAAKIPAPFVWIQDSSANDGPERRPHAFNGTFCPALITLIPEFQTKILRITFTDPVNRATALASKADILNAVKRNFNFEQFGFEYAYHWIGNDNVSVLTAANRQQLEFYYNRNDQLAKWVKNPFSVPKHLWSLPLKLAQEAGEKSLYYSLLAGVSGYEASERSTHISRLNDAVAEIEATGSEEEEEATATEEEEHNRPHSARLRNPAAAAAIEPAVQEEEEEEGTLTEETETSMPTFREELEILVSQPDRRQVLNKLEEILYSRLRWGDQRGVFVRSSCLQVLRTIMNNWQERRKISLISLRIFSEVLSEGVCFLTGTAHWSIQHEGAITSSGMLQATISILNKYPNDLDIQQVGLGAIENFSYSPHAALYFQPELQRLTPVVAAMEAFPDDVTIQRRGTFSLASFARQHGLRGSIVRAGGRNAFERVVENSSITSSSTKDMARAVLIELENY